MNLPDDHPLVTLARETAERISRMGINCVISLNDDRYAASGVATARDDKDELEQGRLHNLAQLLERTHHLIGEQIGSLRAGDGTQSERQEAGR